MIYMSITNDRFQIGKLKPFGSVVIEIDEKKDLTVTNLRVEAKNPLVHYVNSDFAIDLLSCKLYC